MQHRQSTTHWYKPFLAVFVVIAVTVFFTQELLPSPPGEWMRHLASVHVTVIDALKNRSPMIYNFVHRSYGIVGNGSVATDLTTAPPENPRVNKTGRYVSMCRENFNGRRTGNQLFNFAAMLHVAQLTGRRVAMLRTASPSRLA